MQDKVRKEISEKVAACMLSLTRAVQNAGGSLTAIKFEEISLMDFIHQVAAPNHISFHYTKPSDVIKFVDDLLLAPSGTYAPKESSYECVNERG